MFRCPGLALCFALTLLGGCFHASDEGGGSASGGSAGTGNGLRFGMGNITAGRGGASTVLGSVRVPDGEQTGNVATVTGSIRVGDNATLAGATTVTGSITLGTHSSADSLTTVNGSISLSDDARVAHAVTAVNGQLTLHNGSEVDGSLSNVNGTIELDAARVGGGIRTVNGDINVGSHSRVDGGILIQNPSGRSSELIAHEPRVVIAPDAVVNGELRFERKVELYVSERATIGPVIGATAVRYSAEAPPAG